MIQKREQRRKRTKKIILRYKKYRKNRNTEQAKNTEKAGIQNRQKCRKGRNTEKKATEKEIH